MNAEQIQALLNGPWCQPMDCGEHKPRHFLIRFEDQDVGDITTTDEAEARDLWNRYDKNWNCWLFAAMPRAAAPDLAQAALTAMAERDALQARHDDDRQELNRMTAEMEERHERFVALQARVKALEAGLAWYGEQSRLARLIHSEGDAGRHAIANDGGAKARALLSKGSPDA